MSVIIKFKVKRIETGNNMQRTPTTTNVTDARQEEEPRLHAVDFMGNSTSIFFQIAELCLTDYANTAAGLMASDAVDMQAINQSEVCGFAGAVVHGLIYTGKKITIDANFIAFLTKLNKHSVVHETMAHSAWKLYRLALSRDSRPMIGWLMNNNIMLPPEGTYCSTILYFTACKNSSTELLTHALTHPRLLQPYTWEHKPRSMRGENIALIDEYVTKNEKHNRLHEKVQYKIWKDSYVNRQPLVRKKINKKI